MEIKPGTRVTVRSADGKHLPRRAVTGVEKGADFPIVWVSREEEWAAAETEGRDPDAVPWPAEDVEADENEIAHRIVEEATTQNE
jgi:hypothetical protein